MSRLILALSALVLAFAPAVSQPPAAAVDALVKRSGITPDGPGLAVLVLQDGRTVFEKCYGLANLTTRTPVTPQTTFELASLTKPFTATAVMILQERGRLALDDDVRQYLPELPKPPGDRPIRLRDLLHHTSGLPGPPNEYLSYRGVKRAHPKYLSNDDYLPEFARHPSNRPPGESHEYSNSNYLLLASVIERVSKKSYGTFMHDEIFEPLGMASTWVYESPRAAARAPKAPKAIGYDRDEKNKPYEPGWGSPPDREEELLTVGDGGIWTNLDDLARFDAGERTNRLLKPETVRQMLVRSKTRDGKSNGYGLGWALVPNESGKVTAFFHDGSWGGFHTSYHHNLVTGRTIILLSNRGDFDLDKFWYPFNDLLDKK